MDEHYDVIVLGTGLTECILSGLLSVDGLKVLHMDRNDYYGGDSASLNLTQLFRKFRDGAKAPEALGRDRDYNIDLIPKFMMANEDLVNILVYTDVTRYLEFKQISGSYVYRDGKIAKVPTTETEALKSSLLGMFEKLRARTFFQFVQGYDLNDPKTHQGVAPTMTMGEVFTKYSLDTGIQDMIGHAMCLFLDDGYKSRPFSETYTAMKLYTTSLARYGKSPYIYPNYGLGELPQAFARLSAIYGGTYMLEKPIDEIVRENGKVVGVRSGEETAKCSNIICDPSYAPEQTKKVGQVIRTICMLNHPIPNTDDSDSLQLIIPMNQVGRKHDIYVTCVSASLNTCPKNYYVAMISTMVETANPEKEIEIAIKLLGPIVEKFTAVSDIMEPTGNGTEDRLFISNSFDATSHFQTVTQNVRSIYKALTGKDLELKKRPPQEQEPEPGDEQAQQ